MPHVVFGTLIQLIILKIGIPVVCFNFIWHFQLPKTLPLCWFCQYWSSLDVHVAQRCIKLYKRHCWLMWSIVVKVVVTCDRYCGQERVWDWVEEEHYVTVIRVWQSRSLYWKGEIKMEINKYPPRGDNWRT